MTVTSTETRTVVVEREIAHAPEKIWRALTAAASDRGMADEERLRAGRGPQVQAYRRLGRRRLPGPRGRAAKTLAYSWAAHGLESIVTWTLTPTSGGTHLRMEQTGFRPDQEQAYRGAKMGWQNFFAKLEQVLARVE